MDFYLLLYISGYSGKTMEECNVMVMEKNSDAVSDTAQKMKFSIKDFFDLFTFTKEILNGKLHFLCSATTTTLVVVRPGYILIFEKRYISY